MDDAIVEIEITPPGPHGTVRTVPRPRRRPPRRLGDPLHEP